MKVVVAMDSFKGSMRAVEACRAVRRGLLAVRPRAAVLVKPMADGGEGTAEAVRGARDGRWIARQTMGPLPEHSVEAGYVWLPGGEALVEMASASGLERLEPHERDPLRTTTFGTGELLAAAAERGARRVWLGIGGSATVDGGVGAALAVGWRILDAEGARVGLGGAALEDVVELHAPISSEWRRFPRIDVLCDVDNPLLGPRGAARVFGPQKGATPEQVRRLEAGLANLAERVEACLGIDVRDLPGAGAAGGLGAGAVAFFGATLVSGVDAVMEAIGLEEALRGADWVITGEGRFDEQSLFGKVVSGVARRAAEAGIPVAVLAGQVEVSAELARRHGVEAVESAAPAGLRAEDAMRRAPELLTEAAERFARQRL